MFGADPESSGGGYIVFIICTVVLAVLLLRDNVVQLKITRLIENIKKILCRISGTQYTPCFCLKCWNAINHTFLKGKDVTFHKELEICNRCRCHERIVIYPNNTCKGHDNEKI